MTVCVMIGVGEGESKACGNKFLTVCLLFLENMTFYYHNDNIILLWSGENKMSEEDGGPLKCVQPPHTDSLWAHHAVFLPNLRKQDCVRNAMSVCIGD